MSDLGRTFGQQQTKPCTCPSPSHFIWIWPCRKRRMERPHNSNHFAIPYPCKASTQPKSKSSTIPTTSVQIQHESMKARPDHENPKIWSKDTLTLRFYSFESHSSQTLSGGPCLQNRSSRAEVEGGGGGEMSSVVVVVASEFQVGRTSDSDNKKLWGEGESKWCQQQQCDLIRNKFYSKLC